MAKKPKATSTSSSSGRGHGEGKKPKKRPIEQYDHADEKRANNPPVGLVTPATDPDSGRKKYEYDPHLDPQLVWASKAEHTSFEVPTVSLHVHERIDPKTIIAAVRKQNGNGNGSGSLPSAGRAGEGGRQLALFEQSTQNPPIRDAVEFYQHQHNWSNRLVAGDSLLVMNSLLEKEGLAGKVQMVYIDPPYGIRYGSNFQPFTNRRDVKDGRDEDLTQEPETIRAFRDTWELGIHSYLTYLRDRLLLARELLHESGSIFVQISDENLHHVRELMDEVFGSLNFCGLIAFSKTTGQTTTLLAETTDFLLWFGKSKVPVKWRSLFDPREPIENPKERYVCVETPSSELIDLSFRQKTGEEPLPVGRILRLSDLTSQTGVATSRFEVQFDGMTFVPPAARGWSTSSEGIERLRHAGLLHRVGSSIVWKNYRDTFPYRKLTTDWRSLKPSGFGEQRIFVVQTIPDVIARCLLMTTDPGDLVFDPTCGSGTTAYVAEQWGRRWITCDTSRVAVTLAKQRLMTATFDYYQLAHPEVDPLPVPHHGEGPGEGLRGSPSPGPGEGPGEGILREGPGEALPPRTHGRPLLDPEFRDFARRLRQEQTDAEKLMWGLLRDRRLAGFKFRRQHPVDPYVLDFYCHEEKLAVELDGGQHNTEKGKRHDEKRSAVLSKHGVRVVRFWDHEILQETESVLEAIYAALVPPSPTSSPGPSPGPGEGRRTPGALGVKNGFIYKTVPHVTLKSIANNPEIKPGMSRAAIDAAIAKYADQETLYDQPLVDKSKARITGPFTVEAVPAATVKPLDEIDTNPPRKQGTAADTGNLSSPSLTLRANVGSAVARSGETVRQAEWRDELLKTGIRGRSGQRIEFSRVETLGGTRWLHADAETKNPHPNPLPKGEGTNPPSPSGRGQGEGALRAVISFGPEHAPLEQRQVARALEEAETLRPKPKLVIFAAFQFDPEAAKDIDETNWPGVTLLKAQMNADMLTDDLKKKRTSNDSYWLIGQPDVELLPLPPGEGRGEGALYQVTIHGFDYYNTRTGTIDSGDTTKIAMWLLDTDYDGRSLYPRQVFFPMSGEKDGWSRLAKNLKAEIDEAAIEQYRGTTSLPFTAGEHNRVAVKIIDDRGIESLRIIGLG